MKSTLLASHIPEAPHGLACGSPLHGLFEAQAEARPDAIAVVFGQEEVTYADLEARTNQLARYLRKRGVERGSAAAVLLPRSIEAYAAILGVLKTGAAYVPIDPENPTDRVAYMLANSGASALVTATGLEERCGSFGGVIVRMDEDRAAIGAECPDRLPHEATGAGAADLCYIIYTSGSTGRPKGVMVGHRNVHHLVRAEGRIFGVRSDDRV